MSRIRDSDYEITEKHLKNALLLLSAHDTDAFDVIDRFQLDVVTEVFCGESTYSLTSNQQPFRDAMDVLLRIASFRQLMGYVRVLLAHTKPFRNIANLLCCFFCQPCWRLSSR